MSDGTERRCGSRGGKKKPDSEIVGGRETEMARVGLRCAGDPVFLEQSLEPRCWLGVDIKWSTGQCACVNECVCVYCECSVCLLYPGVGQSFDALEVDFKLFCDSKRRQLLPYNFT